MEPFILGPKELPWRPEDIGAVAVCQLSTGWRWRLVRVLLWALGRLGGAVVLVQSDRLDVLKAWPEG